MIEKILNGWANYVKDKFHTLDADTKQEAQRRLHICDTCPVREKNFCHPNRKIYNESTGKLVRGCGCHLSAKALSMQSHCPAAKW